MANPMTAILINLKPIALTDDLSPDRNPWIECQKMAIGLRSSAVKFFMPQFRCNQLRFLYILNMISRDCDRAVGAINWFNSGIGWMGPSAFYSIALGWSATDFCVACLDQLIVKVVCGQDFGGDLGDTFDFVFIEGHNYLGRLWRYGIPVGRSQFQSRCEWFRDRSFRLDSLQYVNEDYGTKCKDPVWEYPCCKRSHDVVQSRSIGARLIRFGFL